MTEWQDVCSIQFAQTFGYASPVETHVTCRDITGHTRDELTGLCQRAMVQAGEPMNDVQKEAARLLLEACAAFIDARVSVPRDIRKAVLGLLERGDEIDFFGELDKLQALDVTGKSQISPAAPS